VNLWKDIPAGDKPPELMNVVIEVVRDQETSLNTTFSGRRSFLTESYLLP